MTIWRRGHTLDHVLKGTLSNGKYVGRHFIPPLAGVNPHCSVSVDGVPNVRVDGDTEETGVRLQNNMK